MVSRSARRMLLPLLGLALAQVAGPARAAEDAAGFVGDLGTRAIGVLTSRLSDADREGQFRTLFVAGFDVPAISRFVLGPYWKSASDAQREEFPTLFEAYIVHVYSLRFSPTPTSSSPCRVRDRRATARRLSIAGLPFRMVAPRSMSIGTSRKPTRASASPTSWSRA